MEQKPTLRRIKQEEFPWVFWGPFGSVALLRSFPQEIREHAFVDQIQPQDSVAFLRDMRFKRQQYEAVRRQKDVALQQEQMWRKAREQCQADLHQLEKEASDLFNAELNNSETLETMIQIHELEPLIQQKIETFQDQIEQHQSALEQIKQKIEYKKDCAGEKEQDIQYCMELIEELERFAPKRRVHGEEDLPSKRQKTKLHSMLV